jgi:TetR/AcrR family transcriptional repressor of nem operon
MARAIAFDYDRALERATWLFWKSGYAGTSLRDLLKIMDIGEGSFYNTLKSKKQLYLACVRRYEETEGRKRGQALMSAPTASRGIHALFGAVLDCLDNPSTPSRLVERLSQDRDEGRLPATLDPHVTASVVVTYLQGIWRMALVDYDRPRFERQIDAFLTALGL